MSMNSIMHLVLYLLEELACCWSITIVVDGRMDELVFAALEVLEISFLAENSIIIFLSRGAYQVFTSCSVGV